MSIDIKEIKEIAKRFSPEQIDGCITQQIDTGENVCLMDESAEKIINELAKAQFIRKMMENGMSLADALRELANRMRQIQSMSKGEEK
jgi:hypothetical protein